MLVSKVSLHVGTHQRRSWTFSLSTFVKHGGGRDRRKYGSQKTKKKRSWALMRMKRPLLNTIDINRGDNDSGELFFFRIPSWSWRQNSAAKPFSLLRQLPFFWHNVWGSQLENSKILDEAFLIWGWNLSPRASDKALRLWRALNGDLDKNGAKSEDGILKRLSSLANGGNLWV